MKVDGWILVRVRPASPPMGVRADGRSRRDDDHRFRHGDVACVSADVAGALLAQGGCGSRKRDDRLAERLLATQLLK